MVGHQKIFFKRHGFARFEQKFERCRRPVRLGVSELTTGEAGGHLISQNPVTGLKKWLKVSLLLRSRAVARGVADAISQKFNALGCCPKVFSCVLECVERRRGHHNPSRIGADRWRMQTPDVWYEPLPGSGGCPLPLYPGLINPSVVSA